MIEPTDLDCAYAAGFYESRGHVRIGCQKGRTPRLSLYIRMAPTHAQWFIARWGGSVQQIKSQYTSNLTMKRGLPTMKFATVSPGSYNWTVCRMEAARFIEHIRPSLISDRRIQHADLCSQFLRRIVEGEKSTDSLMALVENIRESGKLSSFLFHG